MRELREDTFFGNKNNDDYEHVEQVLDTVILFNIPGVSHDAVMLCVFPRLDPLRNGWTDFPQEPSIPGISLKRPLSKGTVHHQELPDSLKKSATSSKKETRHYTKLGNGFFDNEEQETDDSGMAEAVAAHKATPNKKRKEPKK
nr:hypothetical protein [Tanacetum cinerariifolium]